MFVYTVFKRILLVIVSNHFSRTKKKPLNCTERAGKELKNVVQVGYVTLNGWPKIYLATT